MHKSVLMDTDIDEGSEVGDVRDDARQYHTFHEIVDGGDVLVELKLLELFTGVATGLLKFLHYVGEGRDAHFCSDIFLDVDGLAFLFIINKVDDGTGMILGHLFDDGIALRMDGGVVKRVFGARDA